MDTNLIQLDTEDTNNPTYADNDDDLIFEVRSYEQRHFPKIVAILVDIGRV